MTDVTRSPLLPRLSTASAPLTRAVMAVNERGERVASTVPCERALTVFVDKRELITLMTLGAQPEWLVLGFLRNQRLVRSVQEVASITVDWDVGAAAVTTRNGDADLEARTRHRVVTTGCGQGSVFGALMEAIDQCVLPPAQLTQLQLGRLVDTVRAYDSVYKQSGSVHGCALFRGDDLLLFVEDVGRHNAVDTIAGWMWLQGRDGADKTLYTTGRLTSEMVIKTAQMGIPLLVSRSGITEMGLTLAQRVHLTTIGRASHRRFLCFSGIDRLSFEHVRDGQAPQELSP